MKEVKFRKYCTLSGKDVVCGKDAEQNELVVAQSGDSESVLHTKAPGSPFCNIKVNNPTQEDIYETAVFCAKYSRAWKQTKKKKDVVVNIFYKRDTKKDAGMKKGCFAVSKSKKLKVKKEDVLEFEKDLECVKSGKCEEEEK